jgi:hypothetical protein
VRSRAKGEKFCNLCEMMRIIKGFPRCLHGEPVVLWYACSVRSTKDVMHDVMYDLMQIVPPAPLRSAQSRQEGAVQRVEDLTLT